MYTCIYVYMYTCIQVYIYTYIYIYMYSAQYSWDPKSFLRIQYITPVQVCGYTSCFNGDGLPREGMLLGPCSRSTFWTPILISSDPCWQHLRSMTCMAAQKPCGKYGGTFWKRNEISSTCCIWTWFKHTNLSHWCHGEHDDSPLDTMDTPWIQQRTEVLLW